MTKTSKTCLIALPALFVQGVVMLSDLLLLAAIYFCSREWGIAGFIIACCLAIPPTRATGGFFFSWRPANISSFWQNWQKMHKSLDARP